MSNSDAIRPERRRFLELVVVSAGGALASAACGGGGGECDCDPASGWGAEIFELSVASGDPRPTSVVLWTRALDEQRPGEDLELELEVATEPRFIELVSLAGKASLRLVASAGADGCVKVRLTDLEPGTHYYYRFRHRLGDRVAESAIGRTLTAPADDDDLPVRFAVMSCQDPDKGYYHAYTHLLGKGLAFIAHLGDYVYESSSAGVARSLDDYRELYRTVRRRLTDAHARFPFLVIPDDHEFSDDSHGATATYFDGEQDETDLERRRNSDQAWFEYMPVDYADAPTKALDPDAEFPDDFTIYRSFAFGRHLELVMTDLRRYRPDHVIAEDAFPGALLLTSDEVEEEGVNELAVPYVDVDTFAGGAYQLALTEAAEALGFRAASVKGSLSAGWINEQLERIGGGDLPEPIDLEDPELLRGLAVHQLLKSQEFSRVGSRYFVGLDAFEAYAAQRFRQSDGASERVMGAEQRAWFLETMKNSTRTFKVWGSEIRVSAQAPGPARIQPGAARAPASNRAHRRGLGRVSERATRAPARAIGDRQCGDPVGRLALLLRRDAVRCRRSVAARGRVHDRQRHLDHLDGGDPGTGGGGSFVATERGEPGAAGRGLSDEQKSARKPAPGLSRAGQERLCGGDGFG